MDYTQNLHLPQWEETDRILRTDFNDAMASIDAAVPHIATGTYTGTGEYNHNYPNTLTFDFAPQLVIVHSLTGDYMMLAVRPATYGVSLSLTGGDRTYSCCLSWQGNTLSWYSDSNEGRQCNTENTEYVYYAFSL